MNGALLLLELIACTHFSSSLPALLQPFSQLLVALEFSVLSPTSFPSHLRTYLRLLDVVRVVRR
jgi:hypothetical protein